MTTLPFLETNSSTAGGVLNINPLFGICLCHAIAASFQHSACLLNARGILKINI
jgi:hypothetical protein